MEVIPIWKDTYYTVNGDASPFVYSITVGNETIFNGKAYVAPNEQEIRIKVNDICKDYLEMSLPVLTNNSYYTDHLRGTRTFNLNSEGGNVLSSYTFTIDWSYEHDIYNSLYGLQYTSKPINLHTNGSMYILGTALFRIEGSSRVMFPKTECSIYPSSVNVGPNNLKYSDGYCGNYALYYLNSYGGWDSFLIEGNVKRTDEYNRLAISTPFNNNTYEWGKRNYNNQIAPKFEITTGYLTDTESEILAQNLLRSNQVYLHDISRGKIWPVILTDAEGQFKTFKGNGRKFITYTINATASQAEQNIS